MTGLHGLAGYTWNKANTGRTKQTCSCCGQKFFLGSNNHHSVMQDGSIRCPYQCPQCNKFGIRKGSWFAPCTECGYQI